MEEPRDVRFLVELDSKGLHVRAHPGVGELLALLSSLGQRVLEFLLHGLSAYRVAAPSLPVLQPQAPHKLDACGREGHVWIRAGAPYVGLAEQGLQLLELQFLQLQHHHRSVRRQVATLRGHAGKIPVRRRLHMLRHRLEVCLDVVWHMQLLHRADAEPHTLQQGVVAMLRAHAPSHGDEHLPDSLHCRSESAAHSLSLVLGPTHHDVLRPDPLDGPALEDEALDLLALGRLEAEVLLALLPLLAEVQLPPVARREHEGSQEGPILGGIGAPDLKDVLALAQVRPRGAAGVHGRVRQAVRHLTQAHATAQLEAEAPDCRARHGVGDTGHGLRDGLGQELLHSLQDRAHLPHSLVGKMLVVGTLDESAGEEHEPREVLTCLQAHLGRGNAQATYVHGLTPAQQCLVESREILSICSLLSLLDHGLHPVRKPFFAVAAEDPIHELIELDTAISVLVRDDHDLADGLIRPDAGVKEFQHLRELVAVDHAVAILVEALELVHDLVLDLRLLYSLLLLLAKQLPDNLLYLWRVDHALGVRAVFGGALHHFLAEGPRRGRVPFGHRRNRGAQDLLSQLGDVPRVEGHLQRAHLVEDAAHRPDVRGPRVGLLRDHLRAEVVRGAHERLRIGGRAVHDLRDPEVAQPRIPSLGQEDVAGLQVSMKDML
mmetsp:Transcript_19554/g.51820  ORF Transcript_19554/g.51820 Transcript_19554/m.51820 type:complete len:660 (+) Transcript_19554:481-2460(+)